MLINFIQDVFQKIILSDPYKVFPREINIHSNLFIIKTSYLWLTDSEYLYSMNALLIKFNKSSSMLSVFFVRSINITNSKE